MNLRRSLAAAGILTLLAGVTTACGDDEGSGGSGAGDGTSVTIATQNFPEANLVGSLYDVLLSENGYEVDVKAVDARDAYMSIFPKDVDIVPEYIAGIGDFLNTEANGADAEAVSSNSPEDTLAALEPLAEAKGISILPPSEATDQNAFFVTTEFAEQNDLMTLSDLAAIVMTELELRLESRKLVAETEAAESEAAV